MFVAQTYEKNKAARVNKNSVKCMCNYVQCKREMFIKSTPSNKVKGLRNEKDCVPLAGGGSMSAARKRDPGE